VVLEVAPEVVLELELAPELITGAAFAVMAEVELVVKLCNA